MNRLPEHLRTRVFLYSTMCYPYIDELREIQNEKEDTRNFYYTMNAIGGNLVPYLGQLVWVSTDVYDDIHNSYLKKTLTTYVTPKKRER